MNDLSRFEIGSERLRLVPFQQEHADGLTALNSDPEVMRYITGRVESRAETESIIERVRERWAEFGCSWWTFVERSSDEVVGAGCVQHLRRGGDRPDPACPLEIGWRVRRERWRQGIASEAARAMAAFAFDTLRAEVLYAVCHPDNTASIQVMRKLGMRYRGIEEWYGHGVATYAISSEEWPRAAVAGGE